MEKLLFATTALIATASMASAEVKLSGLGRFGVGYLEDRDPDNAEQSDAILVSRFRLNIDGKTETDSGVELSARLRAEANETATGEAGVAKLNGARFSVIYGGLRLDVGNVDGAIAGLDNRPGNEPGLEFFLGQSSGKNYSHHGYQSTNPGGHGIFFEYEVGGLKFGASYDQNDNVVDDRWDVAVIYAFNNITAGLAHGQNDLDESFTLLTIGADLGNFSGTLFVADDDVTKKAQNGIAYGFSAKFAISEATDLLFAYGDGSADGDKQQVGVGAVHDLGGGASLKGGIGQSKTGDADGQLQADFGVNFDF